MTLLKADVKHFQMMLSQSERNVLKHRGQGFIEEAFWTGQRDALMYVVSYLETVLNGRGE